MPSYSKEHPTYPRGFEPDLKWEGRFRPRVVSVFRNHQVELTRQDAGQRFRDFAELAVDICWETDARLRFVYVSSAFEELTSVAPQQHIGESYRRLILEHAADSKAVERHLATLNARLPFKDFEETWCHPDGTERILSTSGRPFYDEGVFQGYRCVAKDVTEARYLARRMTYQATHDSLTGLVNRPEFERRLERALTSARNGGLGHSLCFLDLDQFKVVNDSAGHLAGDDLLRHVARLLGEQIRTRDTAARIGGDEFALLIENCPTGKAKDIADALLTKIRELRFARNGLVFEIGASIGLTPITRRSTSVRHLLNTVDVACYCAKSLGRNRVHICDEVDPQKLLHISRRYRVGRLSTPRL